MKALHLHFIGIGGSGMAGVAKLASKMGYEVTGCDLEDSTAYVKGISKGHSPDHLKGIDLIVVSPAIYYQDSKNPELVEGQKRGILITWQEFLGKTLLKDKKLICVAGTHGKSTTTAMAGKLLIDNGFDPIVVLGAVVPAWGGSSRYGEGEYAVVEADEFNNNFLNYHPDIAIVNNIEFDHPDFFKNEKEVKESFDKFINNLTGRKILITQKDSLNKKFNLKVPGIHNQKNANMVFVLGRKLGIRDEEIEKSLEDFGGIGRRMELVGEVRGIKVYDDYAHHPTEIAATLEGLREIYQDKKILAVVEAHGYKRTKALLPKYKGVFDAADKVIVGPIFQARDEIDESVTPALIAKTSNHKDALGFENFDKLIGNWKMENGNSNYEVIVVMGAGKSYLWAREIVETLRLRSGLQSFKNLTSFGIGGKIKKYFEVKDKKELETAVGFAKKNRLPVFVIGDGTDILASDKNFNGVVIKFTGQKLRINNLELKIEVAAEAGMNWDDLVKYAVENNLQGIECLSGIPGTVGASPIQNIGAYGQELKDTFVSLEAYDIDKEKFVKFNKDECGFGYRESIFKQKKYWQKYVIVSVTLKLVRNKKPKAAYESLSKYLPDSDPSLKQVRDAVLAARAEKLENPKVVGNAGSFFKNPVIGREKKEELEKRFPGIKIFAFGDDYKVSAAWLIENSGWKGKDYGNAGVSPKHALILINRTGKASAEEIIKLSEKIIEDVDKKYGVKLEREVQLINFNEHE